MTKGQPLRPAVVNKCALANTGNVKESRSLYEKRIPPIAQSQGGHFEIVF